MIEENNRILVKSLAQSLSESVECLAADIAEVTLDSFLNEGLIKDLPIVSSAVSVFKIGYSIKELAFRRKLTIFIHELNRGIANDKERQKYINQIEEDSNKSQKLIEHILLMIDRFIQSEKSQLFAKLVLSYLKKDIDWLSFCQYSEVLDRMFPGDITCLDMSILTDKDRDDKSKGALQRMQGLGIIAPNIINGSYNINGNVVATRDDGTYNYTIFGKTFYQIMTDSN